MLRGLRYGSRLSINFLKIMLFSDSLSCPVTANTYFSVDKSSFLRSSPRPLRDS
ncbi:hypothetical protein HanRHA438_Chr08g0336101 [Helianthus annuus]|nr:hypothetical protein HanIR_Chr08g0350981 [Helianthus annuus]KAJ0896571.1 hypothetical protein HanRHA438_Chr08g0336101 [Helianthus annuus]